MSHAVFEPRQKVYATLHGTFHAAIVQEVALDAALGAYLYYVHYVEQDSRMDCWLPASALKERRQGRLASKQSTHKPGGGITTRGQSRLVAEHCPELDERPAGSPVSAGGSAAKRSSAQNCVKVSATRARKDSSFFCRAKNIHTVCMGPFEVDAWYFSPYHIARPSVRLGLEQNAALFAGNTELQLRQTDAAPPTPTAAALHVCPFCLQPFTAQEEVGQHVRRVCARHPPGNEIYRDPVRQLVVLELDAAVEPVFSEQLALLSKLFLEHKALDHDMTPFIFYVLCAVQPHGLEVLGYFSKEKHSPEMYNLSCILVLPQFQSRGIGRFLIELSYELSRREGRIGSPEKPLSDLGEKLYLGYWGDAIVSALARAIEECHCVTLDYLVQATFISQPDVMRTLQYLKLLNGTQIVVSEESIERCYSKRLHRERSGRNYVFYPHLLSWRAQMYDNLKDLENATQVYEVLPVDEESEDDTHARKKQRVH